MSEKSPPVEPPAGSIISYSTNVELPPLSQMDAASARVVTALYARAARLVTTNPAEAMRLLDRLDAGPIKTGTVTLTIPNAPAGKKRRTATQRTLKFIEDAHAFEYLRFMLRAQARGEKPSDDQAAREVFSERMAGPNPPDPSDLLKPAKMWAERIRSGAITIPDELKPPRKPRKS